MKALPPSSMVGLLTVQLIYLGQIGENTGQLLGAQYGSHPLEEHLVENPECAQV